VKAALITLAVWCAAVLAQSQQPASSAAQLREARHREGLVATRAIAYFQSMDSLEERLKAMGMTLNQDLVSLRKRIEDALDATDAAIEKKDAKAANKSLDLAEALVKRLGQKLEGG
jgi:hypothetical protein